MWKLLGWAEQAKNTIHDLNQKLRELYDKASKNNDSKIDCYWVKTGADSHGVYY